jgi:hypothetical protein
MARPNIPQAFLVSLTLLLLVVISVRYGIYVQKRTQVNEYLFNLQTKLSLTPSPVQKMPLLKKHVDEPCGVTYLLPEAATMSAQVECAESAASNAGELRALGYQSTMLNTREIFFRIDALNQDLVRQSLTLN